MLAGLSMRAAPRTFRLHILVPTSARSHSSPAAPRTCRPRTLVPMSTPSCLRARALTPAHPTRLLCIARGGGRQTHPPSESLCAPVPAISHHVAPRAQSGIAVSRGPPRKTQRGAQMPPIVHRTRRRKKLEDASSVQVIRASSPPRYSPHPRTRPRTSAHEDRKGEHTSPHLVLVVVPKPRACWMKGQGSLLRANSPPRASTHSVPARSTPAAKHRPAAALAHPPPLFTLAQ
ncbi:hypothetical protein DFH06DRAFT_1308635 [Mycena polygramma]|nr:hypothetical protein DFH06DRAFT_1308635 [Mycena polygramma]